MNKKKTTTPPNGEREEGKKGEKKETKGDGRGEKKRANQCGEGMRHASLSVTIAESEIIVDNNFLVGCKKLHELSSSGRWSC